jgi:hypothetical protein
MYASFIEDLLLLVLPFRNNTQPNFRSSSFHMTSCRRHGLNPFEYLKDLFTRLPAAKITQIKRFTPSEWAKAKVKERLIALAA